MIAAGRSCCGSLHKSLSLWRRRYPTDGGILWMVWTFRTSPRYHQRLIAEPRIDPQGMQRQVLRALIDRDLARANRLRAMAKQNVRGLCLFFSRTNAHQQDELAGDQLGLEMSDALACKDASQPCSEPGSDKSPDGRSNAGP